MAACLLSALILLTSFDRGSAANVSTNESLIDTGPRSGWCPNECSCVLTYHVDCMNVGIGVLRVGMFPANSSNIRSLWLDYTNLTKLEVKVFKRMRYLKRLSLSNNYLTQLNPRLFSGLSSLRYLDIRNNCLVSPLNNDVFKPLGQLLSLKLDYNKLTTLDSKILTPVAHNITEITLSNNPFICDCNIRDAVEWFKTYQLSSEATCGYPSAGVSWKTLTFAGHCEIMHKPNVDLTCHLVTGSVKEDADETSESFPLLLVLVAAVCGFLLLLCGGLSLYFWRRANRNLTPNLDRRINENKHYDDVRSNDDYYYESIRSLPRYMSVATSSRPGSAPELPKRPEVSCTKLNTSSQAGRYDDVGNVRSRISDSDSYINPENLTANRESLVDKSLAPGGYIAMSENLKLSGAISSATEEKKILSTTSQDFKFQINEADEEKEDEISALPDTVITPTSAIRYDGREIIEFPNFQTQESEYPWNRESFWKI